jgi:hypothetical protein
VCNILLSNNTTQHHTTQHTTEREREAQREEDRRQREIVQTIIDTLAEPERQQAFAALAAPGSGLSCRSCLPWTFSLASTNSSVLMNIICRRDAQAQA